MTIAHAADQTPRKPLRLWPGVVAAVLVVLLRFVVPIVVPNAFYFRMMGSFAGSLAIVVWWVFFSRAPWSERFQETDFLRQILLNGLFHA